MTHEQILAECREWFTDPDFGRLRALREGPEPRRLIGCFPVYTPEEIVMAAGLVPVHLFGGGTMVEIDHADSRMQSFVCSITRSTFELGLTKRLSMLDGMLFPSICDVARNLSGLWRRNFPDQLAEFIHFPENFESAHAVPYLRHELERLGQRLAAISGHEPSTDDYRRVFGLVNRWQAAVGELYALRAEAPWKVPLADAYAVVRAGGMMPREQHLPLLEQALATWREAGGRPQDRVRVIVEGSFCEQPSLELLQAIEEAGCYVVDDDYLLGMRWHTAPLPLDGDPLETLARHILERCVPSAVHHPGPKGRAGALLAKARAARAEGVVFCIAKFCEPALYDFALLKRALETEGVPYLSFEFEEKMSTFESIRTQLETFVESILLFS
jgi:benzoyl-CoA reductase subunit C